MGDIGSSGPGGRERGNIFLWWLCIIERNEMPYGFTITLRYKIECRYAYLKELISPLDQIHYITYLPLLCLDLPRECWRGSNMFILHFTRENPHGDDHKHSPAHSSYLTQLQYQSPKRPRKTATYENTVHLHLRIPPNVSQC
jgi:hypothetical protein